MNTVLTILLLGTMIMVVVSLVRGIAAFLHSSRMDIDEGGDGALREQQLKQNKMMQARILYQGLAILVVALLLAANG